MPIRLLNVALLLGTCLALGLSGCAHLSNRRNCSPSPNCSAAVSTPKNSLPTIEFETRADIQFSDLTNPIEGSPIAVDPANRPAQKPESPTLLRDLTLVELRRLANQSAPIATRLESHRDWLATLERTPPAILEALTHQARFERSKHRHLATAAYLNLVQVYTKSPILNRTDEVLLEAETAIEKFRQAGIEVPGDPEQLQRRRVEITEQYVEVRYNQLRLHDALESLLNLTPCSQEPIWTNFQTEHHASIPHESAAVELAFSQRGDLQALEQLLCDSQSLSLDLLRGSDPASSLIGAGFDMPVAAKFWQCRVKDEIECLKLSAQGERKRQLQLLVENKREQIRLEVRQSLHAIERHGGNLKLKLIRLDSLRESMATSEKAKDIQPIDFKVRLEQRTDELKLISDIIDELIAIEMEHDKLNHNLGSS